MMRNLMKENKKRSRKKLRKVIPGILISMAVIVLVPFICYGIVHLSQSDESVSIEQMQSLAEKDAAIVPGTSG